MSLTFSQDVVKYDYYIIILFIKNSIYIYYIYIELYNVIDYTVGDNSIMNNHNALY